MEALESEDVVIEVYLEESNEVVKRKKYSAESLQKALSDIENKLSVHASSKKHNIPKSTLRWHSKNSLNKKKAGAKPFLLLEEEDKIADWVIYCAAKGDPRTKEEVIAAATDIYMKHHGKETNELLSAGWFANFKKRHPKITFRTPQLVTKSSANVSEEDIRRFFNDFSKWLTDEGFDHLKSDPTRWLNADETGFELNPKPKRVLAAKGQRDVHHVERSDPKKRLSVMYTFGANGASYKPQIIAPQSLSKVPDMLIEMGACGADFVITTTESGYQTRTSFESYVKDSLLPELDKEGVIRDAEHPVFLFIDGHKSHNGIDFTLWCRESNIHLITFFPNATRILQMCDVGMFGPGKKAWAAEVQRWRRCNSDKVLDEVGFIRILQKVNREFIKEKSIKNGFRTTGIYPLNVENVRFDRCIGTAPAAEEENANGPDPIIIDLPPVVQHEMNTPKDVLKQIKRLIDSLQKDFHNESDSKFHLQSISHHILMIENALVESSTESSSLSSCLPSLPDTSSTPIPSLFSTPSISASFDLSNILPAPIVFSRSIKQKAYRQRNYGVLTSDAMIADCKKISAEEEKKELEKKQRQVIRNMKKEKTAESNAKKKAEVTKKKEEAAKKKEAAKIQREAAQSQREEAKKLREQLVKEKETKSAIKRKIQVTEEAEQRPRRKIKKT